MEKILIVQKYSIILLIHVTGGAGSRHLDWKKGHLRGYIVSQNVVPIALWCVLYFRVRLEQIRGPCIADIGNFENCTNQWGNTIMRYVVSDNFKPHSIFHLPRCLATDVTQSVMLTKSDFLSQSRILLLLEQKFEFVLQLKHNGK